MPIEVYGCQWVSHVVVGSVSRGTWSVVTTERQTFNGARRFTAGTEGRAAKLGSYGGLQRAREVACKVPDAWQSMWVDDSTAEAHARARSAGKRARRGEQGLAAPVARGFRLLRLHRRKAHREALCGQAGGPLSREMARGRSMPGQKVGVRFIDQSKSSAIGTASASGVRSRPTEPREKSGGVRASRKRLRGAIPRGGERRPIVGYKILEGLTPGLARPPPPPGDKF